MSPIKSIALDIFKNIALLPDEIGFINSKFERIELKKGAILLKANETVLHQYYVVDGCLRTFFLDPSGKEHTIQFAIKDWWISDYTAFFSSTKAIMNIECIHNATLYKVSKKDIDLILSKTPLLETFFRKKMEGSFASFQKRILATLAQTAKERYVSFISSYPNIEQSVKNYHIASYLGVTTESLSRIRKGLAKK